jgi:4-hydroxybenzoate polyprenyltransferase
MSADPQASDTTHSRIRPADSVRVRYIDRAPAVIEPYFRLMRLDRPIGIWLLFWPCIFGLELGASFNGYSYPPGLYVLLVAIGAILMRGAGCTYNDIVDRRIDAEVARTRGRPIPSGKVTVKQASIFCAVQITLAGATLIFFSRFAALVAICSLFFVAVYPFMKRITWWPQAWLGLTFNWGVLFGFAAMTGRIGAAAGMFYTGCFFWTIGYDTLYALTDKEDDLLVGVKSSAIRLGDRVQAWIYVFYSAGLVLMLAGGIAAGMGVIFILAMTMPGMHLLWQMRRVRIDDPALCLRLFKSNRDAGALIALALLIGAAAQI